MIATPDLIEALAREVQPARRLRPPLIRAAEWMMFAALILALLAVSHGFRPDLTPRLGEPGFDLRVAGALSTGVLAAVAAFMLSLPDRRPYWLLLPLPGLVLWLSTIGYQCLTGWIGIGPNGLRMDEAAACFATVVLTSAPLSLAMLIMLRHAAPLRPGTVAFAGSLAVAGFATVALSLFHVIDASLMILAWNVGTALFFAVLAGTFAKKIFAWVAPRSLVGGGK